MKLMTAITLGAFAFLGAAFVANANAQSPRGLAQSCASEPREVSLYFERDRAELNDFSKALVERVANEARNCGLTQVVAEMRLDAKRAAVITDTFQAHKIRVIMVGGTALAPKGDDVAARSAKMRLTLADRLG